VKVRNPTDLTVPLGDMKDICHKVFNKQYGVFQEERAAEASAAVPHLV